MVDWFRPELWWFLLGLVLLIAEFALPGIIIMFFGLGAWITALLAWLGLLPSWAAQNICFVISSLLLLYFLRKNLTKAFVGKSSDEQVDDEFIGKEAHTLTAIGDAGGKIEFKGAEWNARSTVVIEARQRVRIVERHGLTLHVVPDSH